MILRFWKKNLRDYNKPKIIKTKQIIVIKKEVKDG